MRRDVRTLTCLTTKLQEYPIEPLREIAWRIMVHNEHSSFGAVKKCWLKNCVSMFYCRWTLCRLRFNKSFQSDSDVYCDFNNSTLDIFHPVLSKSFMNSEIVLVVIVWSYTSNWLLNWTKQTNTSWFWLSRT